MDRRARSTFNVKRSLATGGPYTTIKTGVTATNYKDTTVTGWHDLLLRRLCDQHLRRKRQLQRSVRRPRLATYKPVAYWRFEEGVADTHVVAGNNLAGLLRQRQYAVYVSG